MSLQTVIGSEINLIWKVPMNGLSGLVHGLVAIAFSCFFSCNVVCKLESFLYNALVCLGIGIVTKLSGHPQKELEVAVTY